MRTPGETAKEYSVDRASTGIKDLDLLLSGGFPRGSLILVCGNPGTGKTIFTANFLYDGAKNRGENGIYLSFSEGKRSFFDNMRTVGLDFDGLDKAGSFHFLEMFTATREGMGKMTTDIVEAIRKFGAKRLVIDSYSVMAQAMGGQFEARQVLHTVLSKIVRNMGCTTLVIAEQPSGDSRIGDASEEFVADGVLNLKFTIPRELEIRKMRGTRLKTRNAIYTIDGGFRVLTTNLATPAKPQRWKPVPDSGDLLSTGSRDLDAILGGGFPKGSYFVVEVATDVQISEMRLLTRAISLNFINQGRGTMIVPTGGIDSKGIKDGWRPYTTEDEFDRLVRIQEPVPSLRVKGPAKTLPPYMIPIMLAEGARGEKEIDDSSESFDAAYVDLKARTGQQPVLRNIGYDNLEASYARFPEKLLNEIGTAIVQTRTRGDLTMGLARPNLSLLPKVLAMVDWHIRLTKKDGLLMLQGVKPYTNVYAVDCDVSSGSPVMKLTILI
jgi:KaiC/GvpD/RAD55 family RecA-like ATPase